MKPGKSQTEVVTDSVLEESSNSNPNQLLEKHISNSDLHTSALEKEQIKELNQKVSDHTNNGKIHVTEEQVQSWDDKETKTGAQEKANKIKSLLNKHNNDYDAHVTPKEKERFNDKYTRSEINALLSSIVTNINWLEEVETYDNLFTKHPNPKLGDTCTVLDTGLSYTFNSKMWVVSLVSFIPLVTYAEDGRMSKEDKIKLDGIEKDANNYIHPDDEFTRHVSDNQISSWENKADNIEASPVNHGLMSSTDKKKIDSVEDNANFYQHPSKHSYTMIETDNDHQFISEEEKETFRSKVDTEKLDNEIAAAIEEAKRYTNNTIATLANATPELYDLLMSIRAQMTPDTITVLLKEVADKVSLERFKSHEDDDNRHVTKTLLDDITKLLSNPKSDWNETNVDSPNYIMNKPKALPADGGNSDTVGGFKPAALFSNRKAATITIGTLQANCLPRSVDFICDGANDTQVIQEAFNKLSISGGKILFREGTYNINKTLVLNGNNITLDSCNAILKKTFSEGVLISIAGDSCIIENISFFYDTYPKEDNIFIELYGSNNIIRHNHFKNACGVLLGSGSYNKISDNIIVDSFFGIKIEPNKANSTYNSIEDNTITGGQYGIVLKANSWSILHNFIKTNNIINCGIGIHLNSSVQINDKISGCGITSNHILRGFGDDSAYGTNQKDILIEYGYKNVISGNTLKKVEIRGSKNVSANNTMM